MAEWESLTENLIEVEKRAEEERKKSGVEKFEWEIRYCANVQSGYEMRSSKLSFQVSKLQGLEAATYLT